MVHRCSEHIGRGVAIGATAAIDKFMFSLVKDSIDSDETEFDYAWGWVFSLLSVLMLLASVVLGCIASGQDVPVQNIGAPPAGQTVVVGKPVEGN
mmetsp:Transcript_13017/g.18999  ORF Transcript_13017/g.18999 Transcript_13017/m.18999 type:complete len:95 (-) Transcript_13017:149-433(-)